MVERGHHDGVALDPWVASEYAKTRWFYDQFGLGDRTTNRIFQWRAYGQRAGHIRVPAPASELAVGFHALALRNLRNRQSCRKIGPEDLWIALYPSRYNALAHERVLHSFRAPCSFWRRCSPSSASALDSNQVATADELPDQPGSADPNAGLPSCKLLAAGRAALMISPAGSAKGEIQSLLKFNLSTAVSTFNSAFRAVGSSPASSFSLEPIQASRAPSR